MAYTGASFAVASDLGGCRSQCHCDHPDDPVDPASDGCCRAFTADSMYHCTGLADDQFAFFQGAKRVSDGNTPASFLVASRDFYSLDSGRMKRHDYHARQLESLDGMGRNWSNIDVAKYYNPAARPWFSGAVTQPQRGWSNVYKFATVDPETGRQPLGISALATTVQPSGLETPRGAESNATIHVDAIDFVLNDIDTFLSTIQFSADNDGTEAVDGVVFVMELSGELIGRSDGGASTILLYPGADEQRVSCTADGCTTDSKGRPQVSPMISLAHNELLRRYSSLNRTANMSATLSGVTDAIRVGHGHSAGPLELRTVHIKSGQDGVEWVLCVAFKYESLLESFAEEQSQSIMTFFTILGALIMMKKLLTIVYATCFAFDRSTCTLLVTHAAFAQRYRPEGLRVHPAVYEGQRRRPVHRRQPYRWQTTAYQREPSRQRLRGILREDAPDSPRRL